MGRESRESHTESCEQAALPNFAGFSTTELETNELPLLNSILLTSGEGEDGVKLVGEDGAKLEDGLEVEG